MQITAESVFVPGAAVTYTGWAAETKGTISSQLWRLKVQNQGHQQGWLLPVSLLG